jgi:YVTN family beta-propeller protein
MRERPAQPDLDAMLDAWMTGAAPRRAPDRLLEESFARTMATSQARRWPWSSRAVRPLGLRGGARRVSLRPTVALGLVVLAVAVTILALPRTSPATTGGPSVSPSPAATPTPTAASPVSGSAPVEVAPEAVVAAARPQMLVSDGTVLLALVSGPRIARIDAATNAVTASVALPVPDGGNLAIAVGAGGVWVADWDRDRVLRLDPTSLRVTATIPGIVSPKGILADATGVWVASTHAGSVTRIDPATNRVVATIRLGTVGPSGPNWVAAGPGGVWVDSPRDSAVFRIGPATNRVVASIPTPPGVVSCGGFAMTGPAVWATSCDTGPTVAWFDPTTDMYGGSADIGGFGYMPAAIGGRAWVSVETPSGSPGKLVRLDPVTDGVDRTITLGGSFGGGGDIAVAGGSAWVIDGRNDRILRLPLAAFEP